MYQESINTVPGTADGCRSFMRRRGSDKGLCIGDAETMPTPGVFDRSPIAIRRGYNILVRRRDMRIVYTNTQGTPRGNDNLTGAQLLANIRRVIAGG